MFNLVQPAKILEFTASALNTLLNMMGNTFLIFLIVLFTLTEFGSFSIKGKAILVGSDKIQFLFFYHTSKYSSLPWNKNTYLFINRNTCYI